MKGVGTHEVGEGVGAFGGEMVLDAAFEFLEAGFQPAVGLLEMIKFGVVFHKKHFNNGSLNQDENMWERLRVFSRVRWVRLVTHWGNNHSVERSGI